jgi:HK97 family phage major capsid protein
MTRLEEIENRMSSIVEESRSAEGESLDKLLKESEELKKERLEIRKAEAEENEKRSKIAAGVIGNVIDKENIKGKESNKMENISLDSIEYRKAFMEFARTGKMADEFRSVAMTSDNSAVIPATTLNMIVEKLESYGNILPLVSYMSYPAGVSVPTSELASPAVWASDSDLANNGASVEGKITGSVTFSAFPLVKAIGLSFLTQVQSLSAFEAAIANNVSQAMAKALEAAIINGTGSGQPTGILAATPAATVALSSKLSFNDVISIKKAIPSAYRTGAVLVINEATFYDFMAITDNNGQPIARVNFGLNGEPEYQLFGTKVVVTDHLPALSTAKASDKIGFVCQLDKYVVNTAHQADLVTYIDQTTRNKVYQSFAALDGKLVDANGLVMITAPASGK